MVTGDSGYLSSPGYPKTFVDNEYCLWNIMVRQDQKIALRLEDVRLGLYCDKSYVIVRDGMTSEASSLGTFCTQDSPKEITSSGNSMWVELRGSCSEQKAFRAFWRIVSQGISFCHSIYKGYPH